MGTPDLPVLEELIPHSGPMLLLDDVEDHSEKRTVTRVDPAQSRLFYDDDETIVPAWVGLEYMGQTACTHVMLKTRNETKGPAGGILISAKNISVNFGGFSTQRIYQAEAEHVLEQGRLQSCECLIREKGRSDVLMSGRLNALVSDDLDDLRRA